jgi:hypothetical protein
MMKGLTLKQVEQTRLAILNRVLEKQVAVKEAAQLLGLSERYTWRMLAAYRKDGAPAIAHGNLGREPANGTPKNISQRLMFLARTSYAGFNHSHLTVMLTEQEGITLSRSTGRGPWLTLLLTVDDATGTVPYALFREQEDTGGYFMLIEGIIRRFGIPMAVYTDRHSVFKSSWTPLGNESQHNRLTHFSRAMKEMGITRLDLMDFSGCLVLPIPPLLQRPVKYDSPRAGTIINTATAIPALFRM